MRGRVCAVLPPIVLCLTGAWLDGCTHEPPEDLLAKAETLVVNAQWDEAIPVLKEHLLDYPNDPGAHFYLGRCFLNVKSKAPMIVFALGELDTALDLFKERGQPNTIARFDDSYFELICHIERTKVYLKQLDFVVSQSFADPETRQNLLEEIIAECQDDLDAARAINPQSSDVADLARILAQLRQTLGLNRGLAPPASQGPVPGHGDASLI